MFQEGGSPPSRWPRPLEQLGLRETGWSKMLFLQRGEDVVGIAVKSISS